MNARLAILLLPLLAGVPAAASDLSAGSDAPLLDVHFIDQNEGWAVGGGGAVLHTVDGGATWEPQFQGFDGTLTKILMRDYRIGWAVGREAVAFGPGTTGTILRTVDGGHTWEPLSRRTLSGLTDFTPGGPMRAWVVGDGTDQHPSGLFFTNDAGKSWNPVLDQGRTAGWTGSYFADYEHGVLAGRDGSFRRFVEGAVIGSDADWPGDTPVRKLAGAGQVVWAVGDRGQVRASQDMGRTWVTPQIGVTPEIAAVWDFHGVALAGRSVWIVGRPGSVVLHSADGGVSWKAQRTPTPLPLHDIHFIDENTGWAVGALGTVVATKDGGATWTLQRQGGSQAAVLWATAGAGAVPLTAVARYGSDGEVHNVAHTSVASDGGFSAPYQWQAADRWSDGFREAGGSYAETGSRFRLTDAGRTLSLSHMLNDWAKTLEIDPVEEFERDLVLALRLWRPVVVATSPPDAALAIDSAEALTAMGIRKAVAGAADASRFPEQVAFFGLDPHETQRVVAIAVGPDTDAAEGTLSHPASAIGPRLGETYEDTATAALATVSAENVSAEESASFAVIAGKPIEGKPTDLLKGLAVPEGAKRDLGRASLFADERAKQVQQSRNVVAIVEKAAADGDVDRLTAQLDTLMKGLPGDIAARLLHRLGRIHAGKGQWELAALAHYKLVRTYPQHPLAVDSCRWLIAAQTSSEVRRRRADTWVIDESFIRFSRPPGAERTEVVAGSVGGSHQDVHDPVAWAEAARRAGDELRRISPFAWADPSVQLNLIAANRRLGKLDENRMMYDTIVDADPDSRWQPVVASERWLHERAGQPPRPVAWSSPAGGRPHLDAKFDDETWTAGKKWPLRTVAGDPGREYGTILQLRHDDDNLYVAVQCFHPKREVPEQAGQPPRDGDLNRQDRVELLIDVDRDYTSCYRLAVGSDGAVADACWGDASWDPQWYVAHEADESGWACEIAIPLGELTDEVRVEGDTWAFGVTRVSPRLGVVQSFATPPPLGGRTDGLTLMRFLRTERQRDAYEYRDPEGSPERGPIVRNPGRRTGPPEGAYKAVGN